MRKCSTLHSRKNYNYKDLKKYCPRREPSHISNLEVLGSNPGGFKSFFDVSKIADFTPRVDFFVIEVVSFGFQRLNM